MWNDPSAIVSVISAAAALTSTSLAFHAAREASKAKDDAAAKQMKLEEVQKRLDLNQKRLDQNQLIMNDGGVSIPLAADELWEVYFKAVESGSPALTASELCRKPSKQR